MAIEQIRAIQGYAKQPMEVTTLVGTQSPLGCDNSALEPDRGDSYITL